MELVSSAPIFGKIDYIVRADPYVWISDADGDPFLHLIDPATGRSRASVGRQGRGPGDFQSVRALFTSYNNTREIWIFDVTSARLTRLDSAGKLDPRRGKIISLTANPRILHLIRFGDGFVGWTVSLKPSERLVFLDSLGRITRSASADYLGSDSVPERVRMNASLSLSMCAKPDGRAFAMTYANAGRIEIRDSTGRLQMLASVPSPSNAEFGRNARGDFAASSGKFNYVDCLATNDALYALYSGWDRRAPGASANVSESHYARVVEVYDWNGTQRGTIHLDDDVTSLALDIDSAHLFAAGTANARLYRFRIPRGSLRAAH